MRLQHFQVHPLLRGYIEKLWVFESEELIPTDDIRLVVPNGLIKLVIPFKNGLNGKMEGWQHTSREHSITLIGLTDLPSNVHSVYTSGAATGTIGVEFNPMGAYRFFPLNFELIRNRIHGFTEVFGSTATLQEQIANAETIELKVQVLQQFLLSSFQKSETDTILEYCIRKIEATKGTVLVAQLEKETGYSSRWLNHKFKEKLGVSPKNLASIIRFQQFYQAMASGREDLFLENHFYRFYHDQSHFIKDFKRFTGHAPKKLESSKNDFGKIFYKE